MWQIGLGYCYLVTPHNSPSPKLFNSSPEPLLLVLDCKIMYTSQRQRNVTHKALKSRSWILTLVRSINTYHIVHCYLRCLCLCPYNINVTSPRKLFLLENICNICQKGTQILCCDKTYFSSWARFEARAMSIYTGQ